MSSIVASRGSGRAVGCVMWGLLAALAIGSPATAQSDGGTLSGQSGDTEAIHAELERLVVGQPPVSALPEASLEPGPVWTISNLAYLGHGCIVGWTRRFDFTPAETEDLSQASTFQERFGGARQFQVNLAMAESVEEAPRAVNELDGVRYELSEVIFRGAGIVAGQASVEMSGVIIGDAEARGSAYALVRALHETCRPEGS